MYFEGFEVFQSFHTRFANRSLRVLPSLTQYFSRILPCCQEFILRVLPCFSESYPHIYTLKVYTCMYAPCFESIAIFYKTSIFLLTRYNIDIVWQIPTSIVHASRENNRTEPRSNLSQNPPSLLVLLYVKYRLVQCNPIERTTVRNYALICHRTRRPLYYLQARSTDAKHGTLKRSTEHAHGTRTYGTDRLNF